MPLNRDLNVAPYFDDFYVYDANTNTNVPRNEYHRILFKPAQAVQARELTQIQTTLQNQVERFGDSIYQNGSVVKGGQQFFDSSLRSIKLYPLCSSCDESN